MFSCVEKGLEVKRAGGIGFILQTRVNGMGVSVDAHILPRTMVFSDDFGAIQNYIRISNNSVVALVSPKTSLSCQQAIHGRFRFDWSERPQA